MPVNFGQPVNAGVGRGSVEAQRKDGHDARPGAAAAPGPLHQGDGPPLARRNAGTSGAGVKRVALSELQRSAGTPTHPDTVAAQVCGDAIAGRLSMAGRYFPKALTSAAQAAVKGLLPLV